MSNNVEVLIVGQGIAGTCLAYNLYKRNISFTVINDVSDHSSSEVASGLINPITGRNFVKSWMIDDLLPAAKDFYQSVSDLIGNQILTDKRILRNLKNASEENHWHGRTTTAGYEDYMGHIYKGSDYSQYLNSIFSLGLISHGTNIRAKELLSGFKDFLISKDAYSEHMLDYSELKIGSRIQYKDINAERVVFAEGWRGQNNPYFPNLEFKPAKGEVLICRIPDLPTDYILKHQKFFVPLVDDLFWVGSTYQWHFENAYPSKEKRAELETYLKENLKIPYQIEDHLAAVRPSTKDRRPFFGRHSVYENVYMFNGLGTKGFSLAPYWSEYLIDLMFGNRQILHPDLPIIS